MAGAWHWCSQKKKEEDSDGCHEDIHFLSALFRQRFVVAGSSIKGPRSKHEARFWEAKMASDRKVPHKCVCTYSGQPGEGWGAT